MEFKSKQLKLFENNNEDEIKYYVAFSHMLNLRPLVKVKLLEYFDYDVKRAYNVSKDELSEVCGYYEISTPKNFFKLRDEINLEKCLKEALDDKDMGIITVKDDNYPPLLREIPDYPISLYYKGSFEGIDFNRNVAVVGSRQASFNAKISLNSVISGLKNSGLVIVSGLAIGIDTQAHTSEIENNLKTVAVVGSGLDIIYPSQNKKLFNDISAKYGIIFSEYPLKTKPLAQNFPQRNRIVVGMSQGTLVAEARIKSGAMISANLTLDYNRELMCIPGNILNPNTSGIYKLIKNGAGLVSQGSDILNYLNWDIKTENSEEIELSENETKIFNTLSQEKTFDQIIDITGLDIQSLMVNLTEMELKGLIKQIDNKYFRIR